MNDAVRTRAHPRYVVTDPAKPPLTIASTGRSPKLSFTVCDISAEGAFVSAAGTPITPLGRMRLILPQHMSAWSSRAELNLTLLSGVVDSGRPILRFTKETADQMQPLLAELERATHLSHERSAVLRARQPLDRDIAEFLRWAQNTVPLDASSVRALKKWFEINKDPIARLRPDAWSMVFASLRDTLEHQYVDRDKARAYLANALNTIRGRLVQQVCVVHAVPMRPIPWLSSLIQEIATFNDITWHPSLSAFLEGSGPVDLRDRGACLIAIDTYVSQGRTRSRFLGTLRAHPSIDGAFSNIFLTAIVARPGMEDYHDPSGRVQAVVGHTLRDTRSVDWAFLKGEFVTDPARTATSGPVFHYGAASDSPPIYWRDDHRWETLFRPLGYYSPPYRPIARSPFFTAHTRTLQVIRDKAEAGGVIVLTGIRGVGKTYLAARLAQLQRTHSYVFWYHCRPLDSVENLIQSLENFLTALGSRCALSPLLSEATLAKAVVSSLRLLDRPALLVLDSAEHLHGSDVAGSSGDGHFPEFVRQLLSEVRPALGGSGVAPCVLLTNNQVSSAGAVARLCLQLGVDESNVVECPLEETDSSLALARRLIRDGRTFELYADKIRELSSFHPYKTWLLSYWINRCLRQFRNNATAAHPSINRIVSTRNGVVFGNSVDDLHRLIYNELPKHEQMALQVAAAWTLPWSAVELQGVIEKQPDRYDDNADTLIAQWIDDRAPFVVKLPSPIGDGGTPPFALHLDDAERRPQRFEMPSISVRFFREQLQGYQHHARVYGAMAEAIERRTRDIEARSGGDVAGGVEWATLLVDRFKYLCDAGKPTEAAQVYIDAQFHRQLRELNVSTSLVSLGDELWKAIARDRDDRSLEPDLHCAAAAVHANALAEAFELERARAVCVDGLRRQSSKSYRLHLIEEKCLRYESRYEAALETLADLQRELRGRLEVDREAAGWLGRVLTARAQCEMALGRLQSATEALSEVAQIPLTGEAKETAQGLALRHLGTILFLKGVLHDSRQDVRTAESVFAEFETIAKVASRDNTRLLAIAAFKQARVLIERAREWEASVKADPRGLGEVQGWLATAIERLQRAKSLLSRRDRAERKWLPAVALGLAEAFLIRWRMLDVIPTDSTLSAAKEIADLAATRQRARAMEIQMLRQALEWQASVDSSTARGSDGFVKPLLDAGTLSPEAEVESWRTPDNPYKHSRVAYERMYYLWRGCPSDSSADGISTAEISWKSVALAMAAEYRRGTSLLYGSGMLHATKALHRLALECFAKQGLGQQERLEAVAYLNSRYGSDWTLDPGPSGIGTSVPTIVNVLDEIAVDALRVFGRSQTPRPVDVFFTIPAKVVCRLMGDDELYAEINNIARAETGTDRQSSGFQPTRLPRAPNGRDSDVARLARNLALWVDRWHQSLTDARWGELSSMTDDVRSSKRVRYAKELTAHMGAWITRFLVEVFADRQPPVRGSGTPGPRT